jgi:hypothetical protein
VWGVSIDRAQAHAVCELNEDGTAVTLGDILRDPRECGHWLACIPLLLVRGNRREMLLPVTSACAGGTNCCCAASSRRASASNGPSRTCTPSTMSSPVPALPKGRYGAG